MPILRILFSAFLVLACLPLCSQKYEQLIRDSTEQVLLEREFSELRSALRAGNAPAIARAAKMLTDPRAYVFRTYSGVDTGLVADKVRSVLLQETDLQRLPGKDSVSSRQLAAYLTDPQTELRFSPLLGQLTDRPLMDRETTYRISMRPRVIDPVSAALADYKVRMAAAVAREDYFENVQLIPIIGKLATREAFEYLLECAAGEHWGKGISNRDLQIKSAIIEGLGYYKSLEAARLILRLQRELGDWNGISFCAPLARITNVNLGEYGMDTDSLITAYFVLLDSLPTLSALREYGYQREFSIRENNFASRSEYLCRLIGQSRRTWWIGVNALEELIELKDPVVLLQLAGVRARFDDYAGAQKRYDAAAWLAELVDVTIEIPNHRAVLTGYLIGTVSAHNHLVYWHQNFSDYVWSDSTHAFTYVGNEALDSDTLVGLLNNLFGEDEFTALSSYEALTRYPPDTLRERMKGYPFVPFGGPNRLLPSTSERYLLGLAELNDIVSKVVGDGKAVNWREHLVSLELGEETLEKTEIAKSLANRLSLKTISGLERSILIYRRKFPKAETAVQGILNEWYDRQWPEILNDRKRLRNYLKKARVFRLGGMGRWWQNYAERFVATPDTGLQNLRELLGDRDADVAAEAREVLMKIEVNGKKKISVAEFISYTESGSEVPLEKVVVGQAPADLIPLFKILNGKDTAYTKVPFLVIQLIERELDGRMTPHIIEQLDNMMLLERGTISWRDDNHHRHTIAYNIRVADFMVALLERQYDYAFPMASQQPWLNSPVTTTYGKVEYADKSLTAENWKKLYRKAEGNLEKLVTLIKKLREE